MDIGILGPLTIRRGDTPVVIRARKQRTVLLRLVLDVGQVVPTDRLLDDVWGGHPPPQGLVTLRSYISNLRSALGDGDRGNPLFVSDARGYLLALDPTSIDAVRFEQLAQRGQADLAAGEVDRALDSLEAGLALWRGPALPEVADELFAKPHVVRLEELRLGAEEARFDGLLRTGRHAEVLPALEAFVARHPLRERAWGHLVLAQYRAGRAPDALESHRRFRDLLADELGMDPTPAFRRLAELILQQSPELDLPEPAPVLARPSVVTSHTRLVGRDRERERLVEGLGGAFDGHGRLVLVSGPAGIGKTALIQDFAATAAPHGVQVHWGRCPDVPGTPAYWPWTQVVRSVADGVDDVVLSELVEGAAAAVTHLLPDLAARLGGRDVPNVDDPTAARFRQFEAVATFLRRAADRAPLLVAFDDLHWADEPSLDLLAYLAPQLAGMPVVVAATFRDLAVDQRADLAGLLAGTARIEEADHIELAGLSEAEVGELLADTLDTAVGDEQVHALHERSDGNPFFVRQLARLLDGDGSGAGLPTGPLPAGIRHVLRHRLDRLPTPAREVLEAAAVLGRDFDLRHVAAMLEYPPDAIVDPVDTAVEHGLVERAGASVTAQRFVHALVREVLYDGLPPTRTAHLHAAAAGALARTREVSPPVLAEHYWRSAELFPDDRPVEAMLAAAGAATDVLAYEQAEELMLRALELVGRHPSATPALELRVRLQHLSLANTSLRWTDPAAIGQVAVIEDLGKAHGIGPTLVPLWWRARAFATIRGDHTTAVAMSRALVEDAARNVDPVGKAAGHVGAAFSLSCLGDAAAARAALEQAWLHLDTLAVEQLASFDLSLDVVALAAEAIAGAHLGERRASVAATDRATIVADEHHSPFVRSYARLMAALSAAMLDEPDRAQTQAEETFALCEEHGFTMLARLARPIHGWAQAHLSGDGAAPVEAMAEAVDWITAVGHRHLTPFLLGLLAEVHALAGQGDLARRRLEEAGAAAAATGERVHAAALDGLDASTV